MASIGEWGCHAPVAAILLLSGWGLELDGLSS